MLFRSVALQVVQIYAATSGHLDRIGVDKVEKFLDGLSDSVKATDAALLEKIAAGDWSEETQSTLEQACKQYGEDFGYDLDEEGHPLEDAVAVA